MHQTRPDQTQKMPKTTQMAQTAKVAQNGQNSPKQPKWPSRHRRKGRWAWRYAPDDPLFCVPFPFLHLCLLCGSLCSLVGLCYPARKVRSGCRGPEGSTSGSIGPWYTSACCKSPKETPCTLSHLGSALVMWWKTHFDQKWWEWGHGICIKMGSNWKIRKAISHPIDWGVVRPTSRREDKWVFYPPEDQEWEKSASEIFFCVNNISTCMFCWPITLLI